MSGDGRYRTQERISLGEKIKAQRELRGFSCRHLARCVDVSYESIVNWEKGNHCPDALTMAKIARALGCSFESFFHGGIDGHTDQVSVSEANQGAAGGELPAAQ